MAPGLNTMTHPWRLVADVGGTNVRFALSGSTGLTHIGSLRCDDHASLESAIGAYLASLESPPRIREACIAIAAPVRSDRVTMTNRDWSFSIAELARSLERTIGIERLECINDFVAVVMCATRAAPQQRIQVGGGQPISGAPIVALGPGTGLGVAAAVPVGDGWHPVATEGGHARFAPSDAREMEVLKVLMEENSPVSMERLVSGSGLVNLYRALTRLEAGETASELAPREISAAAMAGESPLCAEALDLFCAILGTLAGDLALSYGARGGVYIGGGIIPNLLDYFSTSRFRARFEDQEGRYREYVEAIPTYVLHAAYPGLLGAVAYLDAR